MEVLFYSFLVANIDWSVADLDQWAAKALLEEPRRLELGQDWTPPADAWWQAKGIKPAAAFETLRAAVVQASWGKPALDRVGAAMLRCRGGLGAVGVAMGWATQSEDRPVTGPKSPQGPRASALRARRRKAQLKDRPETQQLEFLRLQIEMRVLGLGWSKFATRWSSKADSRISTVAHL